MARRLLAILALVSLGCEGGQLTGPSPTVDTVLDPSQTVAGQGFTVRCEVHGDGGKVAPWGAQLEIDGPPVTVGENGAMSATQVGTYRFTCRSDSLGIRDDTPAELTVLPADAAKVVATLDPATVKAGQVSSVTCTVLDAYGNVVPDQKVSVDPAEGLFVEEGLKVHAERVGEYPVACSVEGKPDIAKEGATLTVGTGDPVRLVVTATPDYDVYSVGGTVVIGWRVYDAYDNEILGLPATVDPGDDPGLKEMDAAKHKYRFDKEGHYRVNVQLDAPWEAIANSRLLICDGSAPEIEVLWPPRGHTQDGDPAMTVRVKVTDGAGSAVAKVSVNGTAATQDAQGIWEATYTGVHGLNPIVVIATDEFDFEAFVTRGWYFSTGWTPFTGTTTLDDVILPESVLLHLGQKFLDDGDHDHSHPNDLATLVEVLLGGLVTPLLADLPPFDFPMPNVIDVNLLGVRLQGDLNVQVKVQDIVLGAPYVTLDAQQGGMAAGIQFQPLSVGLEVSFGIALRATAFGQTVDLVNPSAASSGSLSVGTLGITVALDIAKPVGGDLAVAGRDFQLILEDISLSPFEHLMIDLGSVFGIKLGQVDLSWLVGGLNDLLFKNLLSPLVNAITQPLVDLLEPLVVGLIGDLLQQVFELLNLRTTLPLPDLLGTGTSVELGLGLGISSLEFTDDYGRVALDLGFTTDKGVTREPPLGSILRDACDGAEGEPAPYVFPAEPSVQAGLSHDAVNELLFAVWWSGMLNGTFDASALLGGGGGLPVENLILKPTFWLPPIFNDCVSGTQEIQIGDLFLDLSLDLLGNTQYLEVWLQASAQVDITATGDQIGIKIGKIRTMEYELYDVGGGLGDLLGMVEGLLPGLLSGIEGQEFSFPIPAIPLDGLIPGLPAGTSLQLGNLVGGADKGLIRFGGDLL